MAEFEQRLAVIARGVRAFLDLKAGVTRAGGSPGPVLGEQEGGELEEDRRQLAGKERQLAELRSRLNQRTERATEQNQQLKKARRELARKDRELTELRTRLVRLSTGVGGVKPEKVVWMFGTGRSGNTWLSRMMGELTGHTVWKEPAIGKLFGEFYHGAYKSHRRGAKSVLGDPVRDIWLGSIRRLVLEGASTKFPELSEDEYLVIKDQPGSIGAPLIMEALPESRMILLVRDPRDVVASWLDGARRGGWHHENRARKQRKPEQVERAEEDPDAYVKQAAHHYSLNVGTAAEAYAAHEGKKVLVRYEELRANTLGTMKRLYSTLGMEVDEEELARAVEKHSWENIPEEKKGEGKFHRKATPGGWEEDLTPEQAKIVEEVTAPLLEEFYPDGVRSEGRL